MILIVIIGLAVVKSLYTNGQYIAGQSGRVGHRPSYVIVAPRRVQPDMVVQIHVTTFVLNSPHLTVRASVRKDGVEYATASSVFSSGSSRLIQMKMPENAVVGNYTLQVEGSANGGYSSYIFQNETQLLFNPKRVSVFISTDKRIYYKRKTIHFRVVALHPNLLPVMSGSIHIFVKDGAGQVVRRWLSQQVSHGYYEGSFGTEHPCKHGWWSIVVQGWGYTYKAYRFKTENYYRTKTDINVTMPAYVLDNEYALAGVVIANQTTGRPVHGNATIELEIRPTGMESNYPTIRKEIIQFTGRCPFLFTLAEMRQKVERLTGAQLVVSATVIDWYFIETKTEKAASYVIDSGVKIRFLGGRVRVFKHGNPLKVFIAVYGQDGSKYTPTRYRQVIVQTVVRKTTGETRVGQEKKYIVPDDSIVKHSYTPESDDEMITIRAAHEGVSLKYEEMTAWKHFTRRNEHIYVSMSTSQPVVDNYAVFTVRTSVYVPHIYYMIVNGGNIITTNTLFMKFRQKTFSLALSRDMAPNAKIVAYCVMSTGEVLADSLAFFVNGIRNDGVKLNINRGKDFSGKTAEVNAFADPASFIAFSATQYQMYEPGANQFFREYDVEDELSGYDDHTNNSFSHTWLRDEARREKVHYPASSYAVDANTTFTFAGLIVFTDADLTRMPAALECNLTRGSLPCFDGTCYRVEQRCDGERQCEDGADELGCTDQREAVFRPMPYKTMARLESHLDDSTWAWKSFYTKPYGRIDFRINLPMRPLLWVIGAFSLHQERGLAFAEYPIRVDATRPFFIKVELPKAAVKGEQLGVQIAVFNYWTQPLEATLTLRASKQYKFIKVQDGGYVRSYNPKTADGDVQTMVQLIPGESRFVHFPIVISEMGKVKVTVCAESAVNRQEVTKTVTIRYDGITNVYQTPYLIDLVSKGSVIIPSFEIVTPERFVRPEQRRHLYVPGSPEAKLTIVGDIVGPGFTTPRLNVRHLMRATYGDGENYVFNFAVNWYWLAYLKATNQLSTKLMGKVLEGLNKDMQAVYSFIQPNGGFANRRKRSPTDTWTTSLAIEFLSMAAAQPEWEDELYLDVSIINRLALWLCSQQNLTTGAFPRTSYVYDIKLHTNLTNSDGLEMNMSMTAYAVIALSRSAPVLTGEAQKKATVAKNLGADYLARHFDVLFNAFDVCLVTYALHEANHVSKAEFFKKMRAIKISGEYIYWSDKPVKVNPTKIINTVPIMQARPTSPVYHAFAVHATAFALLVYLRNNWVAEARPIMMWLQTQRNFNGGFSAPEDTLRATQALVEYALRDTNRDLYNMVINIEASSTPFWKKSVHLRRGTFSDINIIKVPNAYGYVRTTAQGTGLALIQLSTKYNVEYIDQLRKPFQRAFDLQVENLHFWGRNASHMEMTVCARWVRTDIARTSGAAVLEVDIPTGYHTQKQVLRRHQWTGPIYSLRSRFVHQKVVLYFEYLNSSRSCWYFTAERWYPVANMTIQNRVRVYSAYEPALHNTTIYTTMNLFHLHICQVCGSFQCPYCPFYNPACRPEASASTTTVTILIALLTLYSSHGDQLGQSGL